MAARKSTPTPTAPPPVEAAPAAPAPVEAAPTALAPAEPVTEDTLGAEPAEQRAPERTAVEAAYIDALYRERDGYLRYDRTDRAEAVADELTRHSAPLERAVPAPSETA